MITLALEMPGAQGESLCEGEGREGLGGRRSGETNPCLFL